MQLGDSKESGTEDPDDNGGDQSERTLPVVLGMGPGVSSLGVEDSNDASADDETDQETENCAQPDLGDMSPNSPCSERSYLSDELLVRLDIALGAIKSLLEESKENRDNNDRLDGFSKDDEEHRNSKDAGGHLGCVRWPWMVCVLIKDSPTKKAREAL